MIRKFQENPTSPEGRGAFDQLWNQHAIWVEAIIRSLWDSVPAGYDRQLFFDESLQQTCVNLMQRLHGYRGPLTFPSYLREVVRTTVLDERRRVIAQLVRKAALPSDDIEPVEGRPDESAAFRSRYYFADPVTANQVRERGEIIRQALAIHGQQSHHGVKSVVAIRWRWWEDRKIADIAEIFREGERFEGRNVVARLHFASHIFELHARVERSMISLDRTFAGEYHGAVPPEEVREALLQALEVSIL